MTAVDQWLAFKRLTLGSDSVPESGLVAQRRTSEGSLPLAAVATTEVERGDGGLGNGDAVPFYDSSLLDGASVVYADHRVRAMSDLARIFRDGETVVIIFTRIESGETFRRRGVLRHTDSGGVAIDLESGEHNPIGEYSLGIERPHAGPFDLGKVKIAAGAGDRLIFPHS